MPWEKTFDIEEAVDQATEVFWAKGFHSASLADLLQAIGINKGSFYNAFGSKQKLFNRALVKYDRNKRKAMLDYLCTLDDPQKAIATLFDIMIEDSFERDGFKGCFLINTAMNLPNMVEEVSGIVKAGIEDFEVFFVDQLNLGIAREQFPSDMNVTLQAKALLASVAGLRTLSRGVFDKDSLYAIKHQSLQSIQYKVAA